jgi:hypothetical protein
MKSVLFQLGMRNTDTHKQFSTKAALHRSLVSRMSFPTSQLQSSAAQTPVPTQHTTILSTTSTLPPPATFDILPPLHELLSRLVANDPEASLTAEPSSPTYQNLEPLAMHQLAGEVSSVRSRIRRARAAVESLPDMDRTVEEQEEEIKLLQDRITKQTAVLKGLAQAL